MGISHALRRRRSGAIDQKISPQIGQHGHLRIQKRHVNVLPNACALGMANSSQNGDSGIHAGEQICHGNPHLLRAATCIVSLAGDTHQAPHGLDCKVIPRTLSVRTGLAKARDAAVDQLGVDSLEGGVVQAIARHIAHFVIFNKHLTLHSQRTDQTLTLWRGNIASHGPFISISTQIVSRFSGVAALGVVQKRGAPTSGVISGQRAFYLDHISTQISQYLGRPRTGQDPGQIQYAYAV